MLSHLGMSIDAPSGVHDVAESENPFFSAGNRPTRVDALVAFKIMYAKRVGGKKSVSAHVPVGGKKRIIPVVDNGVSPLLTADQRTRIVYPSRLYAPGRLFPLPVLKHQSLGVFDTPVVIGIK